MNNIKPKHLPIPLGLAKELRVCRFCGEPIEVRGLGANWPERYWKVFPDKHTVVVTRFGKEFSHEQCLTSSRQSQDSSQT